MFGSSASKPAGQSLFGGQQQQPSLFGSTGGGTSMFGSSAPAQTSSMFGSTGGGSSMFGSTGGGSSLFGSTAPQQSTSSLFGAPRQSTFGAPQQSTFNAPQQSTFNAPQQSVQQQPQLPWWYNELRTLHAAYKVGVGSKFQTILYEVLSLAPDLLVSGGATTSHAQHNLKAQKRRQIHQQMPWVSQRDLSEAEENNPDPDNWVAAPVVGADALKARVDLQAVNVREQLDALGDAGATGWMKAAKAREGEFESKIRKCVDEHDKLADRFVAVAGRLERLQCREGSLGRPGRVSSELAFHERLVSLKKRLESVKGAKARFSELEHRRKLLERVGPAPPRSADASRPPPSPGKLKRQKALLEYLKKQRKELDECEEKLRVDLRDVTSVRERLERETV